MSNTPNSEKVLRANSGPEMCSICHELLQIRGGEAIITPACCGNSFHYKCIRAMRGAQGTDMSCPLCRKGFDFSIPPLSETRTVSDPDDSLLPPTPPSQSFFDLPLQSIWGRPFRQLGDFGFGDDQEVDDSNDVFEVDEVVEEVVLEDIQEEEQPKDFNLKFETQTTMHNSEIEIKEFVVVLDVTAPDIKDADTEGFDLVALLDKSGSMAGEKFTNAVATLRKIVDVLKPTDRLSIVSYNTSATLDTGLVLMTDDGKRTALTAIDNIQEGGGTQIKNALNKAEKVLEERKTRNKNSCIILMSDGQDGSCRGPYSTSADVLFSFGYGDGHDVTLLSSISDACNGTFTYVTPENIESAFVNCARSLNKIAAKNLKITLVTKQDVEILSVEKPYDSSIANKNVIEATIPCIFANDTKTLVITVRVLQESGEMATHTQRELMTATVDGKSVGCLVYRSAEPCVDNHNVKMHIFRIKSAKTIGIATSRAADNDMDGARAVITDFITEMESYKQSFESSNEMGTVNALIEDMVDIKQGFVNRHVYQARGLSRAVSSQQAHNYQVSHVGPLTRQYSNQADY